jgi:hypothetical protein
MWLADAVPHAATPPPQDEDPLTAQRIGDLMKVAKEALPEASQVGPGNARQGWDRPGHCLDYVPGIAILLRRTHSQRATSRRKN